MTKGEKIVLDNIVYVLSKMLDKPDVIKNYLVAIYKEGFIRGEKKALDKELPKLLEEYRDQELPDWNTPYHYDAEGWAAMEYFIKWLKNKQKNK